MGLIRSALTLIGYRRQQPETPVETKTPEETIEEVYCQHCEKDLTLEGAFISQGKAYCPLEMGKSKTELPCLYLDRLEVIFKNNGTYQDLNFLRFETTDDLQRAIKDGTLTDFGSLELMALAQE